MRGLRAILDHMAGVFPLSGVALADGAPIGEMNSRHREVQLARR